MEPGGGGGGSGSGSGLGKLLPKSISAKRKRRKQRPEPGGLAVGNDAVALRCQTDGADSSSTLCADDGGDGDGYNDADDADGRSLASIDPRAADADQQQPMLSDADPRPAASSPPARPASISAHPSFVSSSTTSPPAVQAAHLDSQPLFRHSRRSQSGRSSSDGASIHAAANPLIVQPPAAAKVFAPDRRSGPTPPPRLETRSPRTPPATGKPAPVIVNTPPTPVEYAGSARGPSSDKALPRKGRSPRASADDSSPSSHNMSAHRSIKSASSTLVPSKLSTITSAPLTPTDEAAEPTPPTPGFFSSVLSVAQSAATTFSNNIPGTGITIGGNRSRPSLPLPQPSSASSQTGGGTVPEPEPRIDHTMDRKESTIRTLGSGDLSLSQLGIPDPSASVPAASPAGAKPSDAVDTRTRSESAPVDPQPRPAETASEGPASRPRSLAEATSGDQTPPQLEPADGKAAAVQRTSSLRSAVKPHRKRGSSVTTGGTGTTAGATMAAANSSANTTPSGSFGAPKLTGFAIASKKRNRDFHNLFKSVPDDDYLIEDYSCALQREILAHGRLYVSEGHLCFSSNILGWTTTLVMSFDEIVSVEKRSTALVFKNGLMISTLHAKHIFASFTSRDATYDLIVNIWKLGHPTLKSTLNGVRLEGTGGDKTEKVDSAEAPGVGNETPEAASESDDSGGGGGGGGGDGDDDNEGDDDADDDDDDDFYDEEENHDLPETQATEASATEPEVEKPAARKVSTMTAQHGPPAEAPREGLPPPGGPADFPGPVAHPPTDCGDSASHYDKVVGDDVIAAPLGKVYNLMFGPASVLWMSKWLTGDQKCTELQMEDRKGLGPDNKARNYSYIKPLNAPIGPRQTKCIVSETLDSFDLDKSVNLSVSTQTPDVPSGNVFSVKTKYCLSWAEGNATRVQVNCTTEWTGKSWLKGPIEKGAVDGQSQYCRELFAALKAAASSRPRAGTGPNGPARAKKKLKRSKALQSADGGAEGKAASKRAAKQDWGPLEPIRGLVEPCADLVRPLVTGNVMYGLLVGLLVAMWFGFGSTPRKGASPHGPGMPMYSPDRLAAYDEMWRREDSELWEWLEERVGLDRLNSERPSAPRRRMEPRTVEERLREERMGEREVEEAVRVTEEKLRVLREVMAKLGQSDEGGAR